MLIIVALSRRKINADKYYMYIYVCTMYYTDRQKDITTNRHIYRQKVTCRQTDRHSQTYRQIDRQRQEVTDIQKQADIQRQRDSQPDRQRQVHRQIGTQTDRQTETGTHTGTHTDRRRGAWDVTTYKSRLYFNAEQYKPKQ